MSDPSFDLDDPEPCEHYHTRLKLLSKIAFDKVDLPSGMVTVKQLRKLYPNEEGFLDESVKQDDSRLDLMDTQEKTIVLLAYASVLGKDAVNEVRTAFHVDKAELARTYMDNLIYYGLAEGLETAKQLLRRIEETGAAIAREHLASPGPPFLR